MGQFTDAQSGFTGEDHLREFIRGGVFEKHNGRYRQTQNKNADIIVLSRGGVVHGHFEIADKVKPTDTDRGGFQNVKSVYLVNKSFLYERPVTLKELGIRNQSFGRRLTEKEFEDIKALAGNITASNEDVG